MALLCGIPTIPYSIRLEAVRYMCTSCLLPAFDERCLVSRACDWVTSVLSAVFICSFQFSLLFLHLAYRSPDTTAEYVVYPISVIGRCQKCGKYVSCTLRTAQGNYFELILTTKVKKTSRRELFYVIIADLWQPKSQDVEICSWIFAFFLENDPLR